MQGIHSTKSGNRLTFEYDASGNTVYENDSVKNKAKEITYDSNNRMTKVVDPNTGKTIGEYEYDDGGFRVRKLAAEIINGAEAKVEVLYPSMYFGIERQLAPDGCTIPNTAYAVNNIYMNGVRIAAALVNGTCPILFDRPGRQRKCRGKRCGIDTHADRISAIRRSMVSGRGSKRTDPSLIPKSLTRRRDFILQCAAL